MPNRPRIPALLLTATAFWSIGMAQPATRLTLAEAEQMALRNHPRIGSAELMAAAAKETITQNRAALYPQLTGNITGVGAQYSSTLAAGLLQTSNLYSRVAAGITVGQLITDFGRTNNLTESARLRASAQEQNIGSTRAAILVEVDQAYYQALAADTVLQVAQAVLENRRLMLRQVTALAQSSLKSTLDVSFADLAASDAELAVVRAENDVQASRARLASAVGSAQPERFELVDETLPDGMEPDVEVQVAQALKDRPDLSALQLNRDAAQRFAEAEKALRRPTIALIGAAGGLPATDPRLHHIYSAAGVNVTIPILNGKLFSARQSEAELRAAALDRDVEALTIQVSQQVRTAWLEANTAFRRLDVTQRLVTQADQSLRLAQIRYDNGLGSIVELNQAQVSQVSAEIAAAGAKYEYLSRRAALAFVTGALR